MKEVDRQRSIARRGHTGNSVAVAIACETTAFHLRHKHDCRTNASGRQFHLRETSQPQVVRQEDHLLCGSNANRVPSWFADELANVLPRAYCRNSGGMQRLCASRLAIRWRCQMPRGFTARSNPCSSLNDCFEQHDDPRWVPQRAPLCAAGSVPNSVKPAQPPSHVRVALIQDRRRNRLRPHGVADCAQSGVSRWAETGTSSWQRRLQIGFDGHARSARLRSHRGRRNSQRAFVRANVK
jgi:hypothetical protein